MSQKLQTRETFKIKCSIIIYLHVFAWVTAFCSGKLAFYVSSVRMPLFPSRRIQYQHLYQQQSGRTYSWFLYLFHFLFFQLREGSLLHLRLILSCLIFVWFLPNFIKIIPQHWSLCLPLHCCLKDAQPLPQTNLWEVTFLSFFIC